MSGYGHPPPSPRASWLALGGLLLGLFTQHVAAATVHPFSATSKAAIERAHRGQPFVLVFWSLDCVYCLGELQQLRQWVAAHPAMKLVLVNTDAPELAADADVTLDQALGSVTAERWAFAGEDAEHLYFAIDQQWRGELPRAYFYDAAGRVTLRAGRVEPTWLEDWARRAPPRR